MRLLDTETHELVEVVGSPRFRQYAILSHTWGDEEVSFQDLENGIAATRRGWSKIQGFCQLALKVGWRYVWVDCVCIDKRSSSELSESINSMFHWYELASICYVYLADVNAESSNLEEEFGCSRWLRRGWTLQELLAPKFVEFYDKSWKSIGTRTEWLDTISRATAIKTRHLLGSFMSCNVATKFGWASQRSTTREEDQAYCLLGLFEINMPLIYGEGRKAFTRLQLEIMKVSDDESIFAWGSRALSLGNGARILAPGPEHFDLPDVELLGQLPGRTFQVTNKGLTMTNWQLYLREEPSLPSNSSVATLHTDAIVAPLRCAARVGGSLECLALVLSTQDLDASPHEFWKTSMARLDSFPDRVEPPEVERRRLPTSRWRKRDIDSFVIRPTLMEFTSQPIRSHQRYIVELACTRHIGIWIQELGILSQRLHLEIIEGQENTFDAQCEVAGIRKSFQILLSARHRTPTMAIVGEAESRVLKLPRSSLLEQVLAGGHIEVDIRPIAVPSRLETASKYLFATIRWVSSGQEKPVLTPELDSSAVSYLAVTSANSKRKAYSKDSGFKRKEANSVGLVSDTIRSGLDYNEAHADKRRPTKHLFDPTYHV